MRFAHTNIIAKDWKSLANFYIKVFSCTEKPPYRKLSGLWLDQGTGVENACLEGVHLQLPGYDENGPTLEIYSYGENIESKTNLSNQQGFRHIAFEVDDVQQVLASLLENGGSSLGELVEKSIPGVGLLTFVYAKDPEGNIIEIQSWRK